MSIDLLAMEREARAPVDRAIHGEPGGKTFHAVTVGAVTCVAERWRHNPPSGVVREHVRVSWKYAGKVVSRSKLAELILQSETRKA